MLKIFFLLFVLVYICNGSQTPGSDEIRDPLLHKINIINFQRLKRFDESGNDYESSKKRLNKIQLLTTKQINSYVTFYNLIKTNESDRSLTLEKEVIDCLSQIISTEDELINLYSDEISFINQELNRSTSNQRYVQFENRKKNLISIRDHYIRLKEQNVLNLANKNKYFENKESHETQKYKQNQQLHYNNMEEKDTKFIDSTKKENHEYNLFNQVRKNLPYQVQPNQVQPNQIQPNQIQPNQNQLNQIQPNQIKPSQIESNLTNVWKCLEEKFESDKLEYEKYIDELKSFYQRFHDYLVNRQKNQVNTYKQSIDCLIKNKCINNTISNLNQNLYSNERTRSNILDKERESRYKSNMFFHEN